jgi:hypothetical protein
VDVTIEAGIAAIKRGDAAGAEAIFRRILAAEPSRAQALHGLGKALQDQKQLEQSLLAFEAAGQAESTPHLGAYHAGLVRLLMGDHAGGWPGWEARRLLPGLGFAQLHLPFWQGGPIPGARLLILAEQGIGDVVQFARFLPAVAARSGAAVTFGCAPPLHLLLQPFCRAHGITAVTGQVDPSAFDQVAWIGSLAHLLGEPPASWGALVPYLRAEPARAAMWRRRRPRGARCVGLCWEGRATHPQDAQRSLPPAALLPLAGQGALTVGLQRPPLRGTPPEALLDMDWGPDMTDLADTLAMLSVLDAVVTVDTSIAHMAGALGVPCWVLLPWVPDWRWGLHGEATPWYPGMTLLRQTQAGDWTGPVARAAAALRA